MTVALDVQAGNHGISRDIHELLAAGGFGVVVLAVVFGLPATSLVAVAARRWLALVPLLLSVGLGALWFAYYATDLIGPQSGPGGLAVGMLIVLGGWVWLALAIRWRWPLDPRPD